MENETVSYYVHEEAMVRQDIHNKRLFILCLIMFIALILTNGAWIYHESMYEDVVYSENTQDGEGINIIGNGVTYGATTDNN